MGVLLNTPPLITGNFKKNSSIKQNLVSRKFEDKIIIFFVILLIGIAILAIFFFGFTGTIKY